MRRTSDDLTQIFSTSPVPTAVEEVADWGANFRLLASSADGPFALAIRGGFAADRLAWAMASGYQAALRALLPGRLAAGELASFCMTEPGGNRPRDLRTTARALPGGRWQLDGDKRWATLGTAADTCFIVCVRLAADAPAPDGQVLPALSLLRVPATTPGFVRQAMPPPPFTPEIPHAELHLAGVTVPADALLPGDGWADHGKPFRTHEDTLVTAAVLAYLLREGRARGWPPGWCQQAAAVLTALATLADQPASAPTTHLALAGALDLAHALFDEAGRLLAAGLADAAAQRWTRDVGLLKVAGSTRVQRAARAWQAL